MSTYPYAIRSYHDGHVYRVREGSLFHTDHPDVKPGDIIQRHGETFTVVTYNGPGVLVDDTYSGSQPPARVNPLLDGRVS